MGRRIAHVCVQGCNESWYGTKAGCRRGWMQGRNYPMCGEVAWLSMAPSGELAALSIARCAPVAQGTSDEATAPGTSAGSVLNLAYRWNTRRAWRSPSKLAHATIEARKSSALDCAKSRLLRLSDPNQQLDITHYIVDLGVVGINAATVG